MILLIILFSLTYRGMKNTHSIIYIELSLRIDLYMVASPPTHIHMLNQWFLTIFDHWSWKLCTNQNSTYNFSDSWSLWWSLVYSAQVNSLSFKYVFRILILDTHCFPHSRFSCVLSSHENKIFFTIKIFKFHY